MRLDRKCVCVLFTATLPALPACGAAPPVAAPVGGASATTTSSLPTPDATLKPSPVYVPLFESGRAWVYTLTRTSSHWDKQDPAADVNGNVTTKEQVTMTCRVAAVRSLEGAKVSHITCDQTVVEGLAQESTPAGFYVSNATGLWHFDEDPHDAPKLTSETMMMGITPQAYDTFHADPKNKDFGLNVALKQESDGAWCYSSSWHGGDDAGAGICFVAGTGPIRGTGYSAGGSSDDGTYVLK